MMIGSKYLAEIKAREQAATPGPWEAGGCPRRINKDLQSVYREVGCNGGQWDVCRDVTPADAAFISAARTDIPALLADNAAKDQQIATLTADRDYSSRLYEALGNDMADVMKDRDTLKKALSNAINNHCPCKGDAPKCEYRELDCFDCFIQQAQLTHDALESGGKK